MEDTVISNMFWMVDVKVLGKGIVKVAVDNANLVSHVDPLVGTVSSLTIVPGHDLHVSAQCTRATCHSKFIKLFLVLAAQSSKIS